MLLRTILFSCIFLWTSVLIGQSVFFNEIDYLSNNNCVEIATAPDQDLTDWFVTTYDDNGIAQDTVSLTGAIPSSVTASGYNIIEVDIVFLQPNTGGLILVNDNDIIVQFISYNTALMAVDGPGAGLTAENIGALTVPGNSLQLQGTGTSYVDFEWQTLDEGTCGLANPDQEFVSVANPLPVDLIYFKAMYLKNQNCIHLEWATSSEENHDHFVLEKSLDGASFVDLISIFNDEIQTGEQTVYNHADHSTLLPQNYYRLRQIDLDGNITFSDIISVEIPNLVSNRPLVYPNPIRDHFKIVPGDNQESMRLRLFDRQGQLIREKTLEHSINPIIIDLSDLPSGIYHLRLRQGVQNYYYPIIKQ